jgi:hypothetical protein
MMKPAARSDKKMWLTGQHTRQYTYKIWVHTWHSIGSSEDDQNYSRDDTALHQMISYPGILWLSPIYSTMSRTSDLRGSDSAKASWQLGLLLSLSSASAVDGLRHLKKLNLTFDVISCQPSDADEKVRGFYAVPICQYGDRI